MSAVRGWTLPAAAVVLTCAKVWVRVAPGRAVRWGARIGQGHGSHSRLRSLTRRAACEARPAVDARIRNLTAAVTALGARRPFSATCLEQSVALVMLLSMVRIPSHLIVGVTRAESTVRAHAWVESRGEVVLGGSQAVGLQPLVGAPAALAASASVASCRG